MATNGMTINGLNPLSALTADDKIPVWDTGASGEPTKEITAQNMANSVKSLASLPNTTEMNTAIEQSTANIPRIKTTAVTGTTNGAGNLLYNTFTGTKIIGAESNNSIVLYFLSGDYYYFKVLSWDDMSPKANVSVTINVVYY